MSENKITAVETQNNLKIMEQVLISGDLSKLNTEQRLSYYTKVCESVGLNPLTKPFEYINLNGKLVLYAKRDATDQLRKIYTVSIKITGRELVGDIYVVTAQAQIGNRTDESIGAVPIGHLKGDAKANGMMKAETKSKRRVTLSICGLGMLDETEVETIAQVEPKNVNPISNTNIKNNALLVETREEIPTKNKLVTGAKELENPKTEQNDFESGPSIAQRKKIFAMTNELKITERDLKNHLVESYGIDSTKKLTKEQIQDLFEYLENIKGMKTQVTKMSAEERAAEMIQ
jgi:hypothetical protein